MNNTIKQYLRENISLHDYYDLIKYCKEEGQLIGIVAVNRKLISLATLETLIKKVQEDGKYTL